MAKKNVLGGFKAKLNQGQEEKPLDALLNRRKKQEPVDEELTVPIAEQKPEPPKKAITQQDDWVKDTFFVRADFLKKIKTLAATTPGATKKEILDQILEDYFAHNKVKDIGDIKVKKGRPVSF